MTKTKATVWLSILGVAVILLLAFSVFPTLKIGYNDFKSPAMAISRGSDFEGGAVSYFKVEDNSVENITQKLDKAVDVMYKRATDFGFKDTYFAAFKDANGEYGVLVKTSDKDAADFLNSYFYKTGNLEIRALAEDGDIITDSSNVSSARAYYSDSTWYVQINFNGEGAADIKKQSTKIASSSGKIYFMMDGKEVVSPSVSKTITTNNMVISGFASADTAVGFATLVNSGAFELSFIEDSTESLSTGTYAGESAYLVVMLLMAALLIAFVVFSIVKFGLFGVGAALSMFGYAGVTLTALALLSFVEFTLASAVGLLIGFCMTCAFNLLIMAKITEEYNGGKTFNRAVQEGVRKTVMVIVDSCAAAFLFVIALWILVYAPVTGFATVLFVNLITSALSSIFLTRLFVSLLGSVYPDNLKAFKLKPQPKGGKSK